MPTTKTIIAISTLINGRKNFISTQHSLRSFDKKIIVNYTSEPEKAKEFETEREAYQFILKVVNPYDRVYDVEPIEVDLDKMEKDIEALQEDAVK